MKKKLSNKTIPIIGSRILPIAGAVVGVVAVAVLGALFTNTRTKWYHALAKPQFQPSDAAFMLVWIALYILIALSLIRLITMDESDKKGVWILYAINGLLNVLWSFLFFQMQSAVLAFAALIALAVAAVILLREVWKKDALAGWLIVPYVIWLAFAMILNYVIIMIN